MQDFALYPVLTAGFLAAQPAGRFQTPFYDTSGEEVLTGRSRRVTPTVVGVRRGGDKGESWWESRLEEEGGNLR